jgi:hypothetical protein
VLILGIVLLSFVVLEGFVPLATAIKIGADEDFELSKATLLLKGYHLYTEIWNDQPPLDTFIITQILKHCSISVFGPRLLTVLFSALLLTAAFLLIQKLSGLFVAAAATAALVASPGFLELSSSCMQEIPALAPAVAGLAALWLLPRSTLYIRELLGGFLFGFALQMKLLDAMYLPLAALLIWLRLKVDGRPLKEVFEAYLMFGGVVCVSFSGLNYLTGNSLTLQFRQSWEAHFASTVSFEYGSPADRPFDWAVLFRNWDVTVPALIGAALALRGIRSNIATALPLAWSAWTLLVMSAHRPWWAYYYIHTALPLCWCAGLGVSVLWNQVKAQGSWVKRIALSIFIIGSLCWAGARVVLEELSMRSAPRLDSCLVLKEIKRFRPFTNFLFSDQPIFSFHAQIPMPPHLGVISLKRLWSGDIGNQRLLDELSVVKPGLILLGNTGLEVPYQSLLNSEYKLVYRDEKELLYAHRSIANSAGF